MAAAAVLPVMPFPDPHQPEGALGHHSAAAIVAAAVAASDRTTTHKKRVEQRHNCFLALTSSAECGPAGGDTTPSAAFHLGLKVPSAAAAAAEYGVPLLTSKIEDQRRACPGEDESGDSTGTDTCVWSDGHQPGTAADVSPVVGKRAAVSVYDTALWKRYGWLVVHLSMILCQSSFACVNVFGKYGLLHVDPIVLIILRNVGK